MRLKPELRRRLLLHGLVLLPALILFYLWYWLPNLAGYNADHAVHALMAEDFNWPSDLYYWNQNRLGSFLPMLASPFCYFGLSGFYAVAIAQLVLVISIYFLFQSYFKSWTSKAAVAVFSLLPIYPFLVQTQPGHPVLAQLFFIGISFSVFFGSVSSAKKAFLIPLAAFLALWSSELSAVPLFIFFVLYFKELLMLARKKWLQAAAGVLLGIAWLIKAKITAVEDPSYETYFTTWPSFVSVLQNHFKSLLELIQFNTNKPGNSILVIFMVLSIAFIILFEGKRLLKNRLFLLFAGSAFWIYIGVCASDWNAIMDRPLHHFAPAYFFLALALLLAFNEIKWPWLKHAVSISFAGLQGVAAIWFLATLSLSLSNRMSMSQGERLIAAMQARAPGQTFGLIGTYWNTYSVDALSENVISIPCEGELVRTWRYKNEVFSAPEIVIVKTGWREDLPDELTQHDFYLLKTSEDLSIDNFEYAYYRVVSSRGK